MKDHHARHHRRSIRLKGFDYASKGGYFITICSESLVPLFGKVVGSEMQLSPAGQMVKDAWDALPTRFPQVTGNVFILMPNHVHGILFLNPVGAPLVGAPPGHCDNQDAGIREHASRHGHGGAPTRGAPTSDGAPRPPKLSEVIGAFKSLTTVAYGKGVRSQGWPPYQGALWQRNYYEHIIRREAALERLRRYVLNNPRRWAFDRENPDSQRT